MKSTKTKVTEFVNSIHAKNIAETNFKIADDILQLNMEELNITLTDYREAMKLLEISCKSNVDTTESINILTVIIDQRDLTQKNVNNAHHEFNICETTAIKARSEYWKCLNTLNEMI